ncbi:hypothetical protein COU75_02240 [Candidatus Peregrinibacteria bacterium CG10_big_fil_rev_8_21_14_0_10_42_8]|nr:MAG: hypothetical protein COU75_02240 [Candidatus Peregrinibacteria bacterium CG10_big_fil_rev_8_21_14_0_10_42_8]
MIPSEDLRRMYLFSDTYGRSKSPFDQDDADALISTDFRSFPLMPVRRVFDIYGRENVMNHMVMLILEMHEETEKCKHMPKEAKDEFAKTQTGIFINAAPRTETHQNGAPFYLATAGAVRIVTTDLRALSWVKEKIKTLSVLPNIDNGLYGPEEQFRSSYTPVMMFPDHGLSLEDQPLDLIPDFDDLRWELAYADRFGNMISYSKNPELHWEEVLKAEKENGGYIKVIVGNVSQRVKIAHSLRDAEPGALVMYQNPNGGHLEIVRKWEDGEDRYTRLHQSAYLRFAKPDIGSKIRIR